MNKKEVMELKRRLKKDQCTFTKMCGCYVNGNKEKILTFQETFLNLEEEEFYKYLEIARKVLSGTVGNNLLELSFPLEEEEPGHRQHSLMAIRADGLKNTELVDILYDQIIQYYDFVGNYLILLFHDAYDVMTKTSDGISVDESEEVFEYILCAICPVELSKPGLGYLEGENRIGSRIRDWVVGVPEQGFIFPAFTDRSTDIHSVMYYTKNAKDTHPELMEGVLGCASIRTGMEKKKAFQEIILNAVPDEDKAKNLLLDMQSEINDYVIEQEEIYPESEEPILLTQETVTTLMKNIEIPEHVSEKIEKSFQEEFVDAPPVCEQMLDSKALSLCEQRKKEKELQHQIVTLQKRLNDSQEEGQITLNVSPEKASEITADFIDGQRCLIIPINENEHATVNGTLIE
ncbi:MAG: DUF4317 domain-containing protein [Lachnospiraceae bacterium]|nr:DUF4317 domain-containing protein [Lachnospiraceae bacterium]